LSRPATALARAADGLILRHFEHGQQRFAVLSFPAGDVPADAPLTPAERVVAAAIVQGLSNEEIARLRKTSPRTVANQVAAVFRKLGARSRAELVASCRLHGSMLNGG